MQRWRKDSNLHFLRVSSTVWVTVWGSDPSWLSGRLFDKLVLLIALPLGDSSREGTSWGAPELGERKGANAGIEPATESSLCFCSTIRADLLVSSPGWVPFVGMCRFERLRVSYRMWPNRSRAEARNGLVTYSISVSALPESMHPQRKCRSQIVRERVPSAASASVHQAGSRIMSSVGVLVLADDPTEAGSSCMHGVCVVPYGTLPDCQLPGSNDSPSEATNLATSGSKSCYSDIHLSSPANQAQRGSLVDLGFHQDVPPLGPIVCGAPTNW
jgi:hypothetical protein